MWSWLGRRGAAPAIEAVVLMLILLPLVIAFSLPTLWLVAPFALVTLTGRRYEDYGLSLRNPGSPRFHLTVSVIVFGTYAVLHYAFARWYLGRHFSPALPPDLPRLVVDQMVLIGLSEEFFFRGYMQTQFNQWLGRPFRFLGATYGPGLIVAAVLFGLCHLVDGDVTRFRTAFFGLFAGWLRERTGTILVPAAYHGAANLLADFMQNSLT